MKTDPCWKGYEMVGTKQKGKKTVPNCVQKKSAGRKQKIDGYLMQNKRVVRGKGKKGGFLPLIGLISSGINSAASAIKPLIPAAKPTIATTPSSRIKKFRDDYNTTDKMPPPGSDMYAKFQRIMTDTNMSKENKDIELDNLIGSGMEFDDLMVGSGMALPGFGMTNFLKSGLSNTGSFAKTLGSALATSAVGTVGSLGVMELYKRWQEKKEEEKRKKEMSGGAKPSYSKNFPQVKVDKFGTLADTPDLNIRSPDFNENFDAAQKRIIDDLNNRTKITKGTMSSKKPKSEDKTPLLSDYDGYEGADFDMTSFENPQYVPPVLKKPKKIRSKRAAKALAIGIPSAIGIASLGALIGTQSNKKNSDEKTEEEKEDEKNKKPTIMYGNGLDFDRLPPKDRFRVTQNPTIRNRMTTQHLKAYKASLGDLVNNRRVRFDLPEQMDITNNITQPAVGFRMPSSSNYENIPTTETRRSAPSSLYSEPELMPSASMLRAQYQRDETMPTTSARAALSDIPMAIEESMTPQLAIEQRAPIPVQFTTIQPPTRTVTSIIRQPMATPARRSRMTTPELARAVRAYNTNTSEIDTTDTFTEVPYNERYRTVQEVASDYNNRYPASFAPSPTLARHLRNLVTFTGRRIQQPIQQNIPPPSFSDFESLSTRVETPELISTTPAPSYRPPSIASNFIDSLYPSQPPPSYTRSTRELERARSATPYLDYTPTVDRLDLETRDLLNGEPAESFVGRTRYIAPEETVPYSRNNNPLSLQSAKIIELKKREEERARSATPYSQSEAIAEAANLPTGTPATSFLGRTRSIASNFVNSLSPKTVQRADVLTQRLPTPGPDQPSDIQRALMNIDESNAPIVAKEISQEAQKREERRKQIAQLDEQMKTAKETVGTFADVAVLAAQRGDKLSDLESKSRRLSQSAKEYKITEQDLIRENPYGIASIDRYNPFNRLPSLANIATPVKYAAIGIPAALGAAALGTYLIKRRRDKKKRRG